MPDCPYGSSYEPATSPDAASMRGPVPVTPVDVPRERSARAKLTAGALAGCGTRVGVGAGVLVLTAGLARCWRIRLTDVGRGRVDTRRGEQRGGDRGRQSSRSLSTPHKSRIETSADRVRFVSTLPRAELFWSTERVASAIGDPGVRIVDCRFSFDEDMRSRYIDGHLPGAVYVNWAEDLSAPPPPSGHPRWLLQGADDLAGAMARLGIGDDTMVVGYDSEGGHHA